MSNPITGLIHVCGEHDTGKTTFALTCGYPAKQIAFIDDDVKGRNLVNQIGADNFGYYVDLVKETQGMKELEVHSFGLQLIETIRQRKNIKVIVWDTWTRFAKTCHPYVVRNPSQFKDFWSPKGDIKGAEQWGAAFQYEAMLIQKLLDAAPLVFLVTHLKDHRIGQVKTGKQIPDAGRTITEKANFRIWLRHNPVSAEPIGLVLKRIEKIEDGKNGLKPTNVLPRKLKPATWERILWYWDNPIGNRAPTAEELPDDFELSILDDTLTADQKEIFKAGLREEVVAIELPIEDKTTQVKELALSGMAKPEIARTLDVPLAKVLAILKNGAEQ